MTLSDQISFIKQFTSASRAAGATWSDETYQEFLEVLQSLKRLQKLEARQLVRQTAKGGSAVFYSQFVGMYHSWYTERFGFAPLVDSRQGAALKRIIVYLTGQSKEQTEEGGLAAFGFVLKAWDGLSPFLQDQATLAQIERNLPEILVKLRRKHQLSNTTHTELDEIERSRQAKRGA